MINIGPKTEKEPEINIQAWILPDDQPKLQFWIIVTIFCLLWLQSSDSEDTKAWLVETRSPDACKLFHPPPLFANMLHQVLNAPHYRIRKPWPYNAAVHNSALL